MPYKKIKGIKGLVYTPQTEVIKKHNCNDCYQCGFCSDSRCKICLKNKRLKKFKS